MSGIVVVSALLIGAALGWMAVAVRLKTKWVDPIGWDESAQRVHDVSFMTDGTLMHYSTCWCRKATS
jgi:hypothetical protein